MYIVTLAISTLDTLPKASWGKGDDFRLCLVFHRKSCDYWFTPNIQFVVLSMADSENLIHLKVVSWSLNCQLETTFFSSFCICQWHGNISFRFPIDDTYQLKRIVWLLAITQNWYRLIFFLCQLIYDYLWLEKDWPKRHLPYFQIVIFSLLTLYCIVISGQQQQPYHSWC